MGEDHECQHPRDSSWSTEDILGSWESGRSLTADSLIGAAKELDPLLRSQ